MKSKLLTKKTLSNLSRNNIQQRKKKRCSYRHKMSSIRLFTYFFKSISSTSRRKRKRNRVCRKNDDDDNFRRN